MQSTRPVGPVPEPGSFGHTLAVKGDNMKSRAFLFCLGASCLLFAGCGFGKPRVPVVVSYRESLVGEGKALFSAIRLQIG